MSKNITSKTEDNSLKPIEECTDEDIKEMFLNMFFWVSKNRPEWFQEAINRKKKMLGETEKNESNCNSKTS